MSFSSIPVRSNGAKIESAWFNTIRQELINFFGGGAIDETQFTIADNQSSYANITGLVFAGATYASFKVQYTIYRFDGTSDERREVGTLTASYSADADAWTYSRRIDDGIDALGIDDSLFVTSAGQVQYQSDSMGGTYEGYIRYKVLEVFLREV